MDRRDLGRGLLTLANVITVVAPLQADWNRSHVFNEDWPSHARFHATVALAMSTSLSALAIYRLWAGPDDGSGRLFAAAVPVSYWTPFFPALLVRGTGVEDPPHPVARPAGIPVSLLGAAATSATAAAGWALSRPRR